MVANSQNLTADYRQNQTRHIWWVTGALTGLLIILTWIVYFQTFIHLVRTWWVSSTYSHCFLIAPLSGYLVWRFRDRLVHISPQPSIVGLIGLLLLALLWLFGQAANIFLFQHLAVVGMVPAIVWSVLGTRVVRALWFPLAYLIFAVPWGQSLVPYLQDITVAISVTLLEFSGIPVFWEGRTISIPGGNFSVIAECSGIRYLIAFMAMGTCFAYLTYRKQMHRLLFVGLLFAVSILANGVRAYGIITIAHFSEMRLGVGAEHVLYGMVFFYIVMLLLFGIGWIWRDRSEVSKWDQNEDSGTPSSATAERPRVYLVAVILVVLIVSLGPAGEAWMAKTLKPSPTHVVLPSASPGWQGPLVSNMDWDHGFKGEYVNLNGIYGQDNSSAPPIYVLVIHYRQERQGQELISGSNRIYGEQKDYLGQGRIKVSISQERSLEVLETRLFGHGLQRRLIWSWYDIGGRLTVHDWQGKVYAALNRLLGRGNDATIVALATDYSFDKITEARDRLKSFLAAHPKMTESRGVLEMKESGSKLNEGH